MLGRFVTHGTILIHFPTLQVPSFFGRRDFTISSTISPTRYGTETARSAEAYNREYTKTCFGVSSVPEKLTLPSVVLEERSFSLKEPKVSAWLAKVTASCKTSKKCYAFRGGKMKLRDNQKGKVNRSQFVLNLISTRYREVKEVSKYAETILSSDWFQSRYPSIKTVIVIDSRTNRKGKGWREKEVLFLKLPRSSFFQSSVLHELAHALSHEVHDPKFCQTYLELVKTFMGDLAHERLVNSYLNNQVSFKIQ